MSLSELRLKIKDDIPISSIIGNYVAIKKSGTSMVALCPFHSDTTPSMHVNDSKKLYKCFSCGVAGDAITFVMKHLNLDYIDALKEICNKQGIYFESYQEEKKTNPKLEMGKKILSKASQLYRKLAVSKSYPPFLEFIKKRGITEEIAQLYNLGFANNENALLKYLNSIKNESDRKFALDIALELKLIQVSPKNAKNQYDTFRDRIIFPIWDHYGHVIGFTSRATRDDQKQKYMNSYDSFLFNKSNLLYGFHLAKNAIREKDFVILVEGNMDQIALYQFGFKNSLAIMGTALGPQSLERLLSVTKNIILALDSDAAGFNAMKRTNQQLAERGIVAKYIEFSPEKDPDEYLKIHGSIKFQEKIDQAVACFDVLLNALIPEKLPEIVDRKLDLLNQAFEILSPLDLNMSATERAIHFSKKIGLRADASQITDRYAEFLRSKIKPTQTTNKANSLVGKQLPVKSNLDLNQIEELPTNELKNDANEPEKKSLSRIERILVQELIQVPSLLAKTNVNDLLDLVTRDEVKKYIGKVSKLILEIDEIEYPAMALNLVDGPEYSMELREAVADALFKYKPRELDRKTRTRLVHDLKTKLHSFVLINKKEELKQLQKVSETQDEINTLFLEISDIEKKLQEIKKLKPEHRN